MLEMINEKPCTKREAIIIAGSCMGCTSKGIRKITKLISPNNTEIRLCDNCIKKMRNAK